MTNSIHASLTAIGGQLRTYHLPIVVEPLRGEFRELVAQLVTVECREQKSAERPSKSGNPSSRLQDRVPTELNAGIRRQIYGHLLATANGSSEPSDLLLLLGGDQCSLSW
jgi:hypothetical protein